MDVTFSRYMQLAAATDRRITVTDAAGAPVDGTIDPVGAEDGPTGRFARTCRFVPARALVTGEKLTVDVDGLAALEAGGVLVIEKVTLEFEVSAIRTAA